MQAFEWHYSTASWLKRKTRLATPQRLSDSFGGAQARLTTQTTNLQVAIGTALQPILTKLMGIISPIVQGILDWVKANPQLAAAIGIATVVTLALAAAAGLLAAAVGVIMTIGAPLVGIVLAVVAGIGLLVGALVFAETKFGLVSLAMAKIGEVFNKVKDIRGRLVRSVCER
jgi:hypothetical protein